MLLALRKLREYLGNHGRPEVSLDSAACPECRNRKMRIENRKLANENMNRTRTIIDKMNRMGTVLTLLLCLLLMSACSMMKTDLDNCPEGFTLLIRPAVTTAEGGPTKSDFFTQEVHEVTLWIYDADGKLVLRRAVDETELVSNNYRVTLSLAAGTYSVVAFAGMTDENYQVQNDTDLDEFRFRLDRTNATQSSAFTPLWHGQSKAITVQTQQVTEAEVCMTKVTNTLVCLLQDASTDDVYADDFSVVVESANGLMNARKEVLDDETITFLPYSATTVELSKPTSVSDPVTQAGRYETSLMRLMEGDETYLTVTDLRTDHRVLRIKLTEYLLMVRTMYNEKSGTSLTAQQYLDYEDEYSLILYISPTYQPDLSGGVTLLYTAVSLSVNGWVIRLDDATL